MCVVSSMSTILPVFRMLGPGRELHPGTGSPIEEFLMYKIASYNGICDYKMCLRLESSAGGLDLVFRVSGGELVPGPSRFAISYCLVWLVYCKLNGKTLKTFFVSF